MQNFISYLTEKLRYTLKYHDVLNPKLWKKNTLNPEISKDLLKYTMEFAKFSGIPAERVHDVVMTGGNANYNYTKFSDIDVHLQCNLDGIDADLLYEKKAAWSLTHDLKLAGYTLEFYAANETSPHPKGQGVYSLIQDLWLVFPKHLDVIDILKDPATEMKIRHQISYVKKCLLGKNSIKADILRFKERMWKGRSAGLERAGEFSIENIIYKELRNRGLIDKLNDKLKTL